MSSQSFNFHTHTARCGHAVGLDSQYVESAIEAGFKILGFSEHIPYVEMRLPQCRMFYERKDEYLQSIRNLKERYKNKLDIKVGYEVEYLKEHLEYLFQMKATCDYMILGQHCKYMEYEYDCYCSDRDVLVYTTQIEEALTHNFITYVAHPDYFMLGRTSFTDVCKEAAHRIARASLEHDVPLEINLNGFHYGKREYQVGHNADHYEARYPYPFREFWEIIETYGCKVVFGYDAHSPISLLEKQKEKTAFDILQGLCLNFVDHIDLK